MANKLGSKKCTSCGGFATFSSPCPCGRTGRTGRSSSSLSDYDAERLVEMFRKDMEKIHGEDYLDDMSEWEFENALREWAGKQSSEDQRLIFGN